MSGSVRAFINPLTAIFEISSMDGYTANVDDELITITYDQADKIMDYYQTVAGRNKYTKSLAQILVTSSGFGLGRYDLNRGEDIARKNLGRLKSSCGELLDISEYKSLSEPFGESEM